MSHDPTPKASDTPAETSAALSLDLGFIHRYQAAHGSDYTLLLLHGTGGNEQDLLAMGERMAPGAALLSPRGKVLENGMPRFFARLAEGVFDPQEILQRSAELADFLRLAATHYGFDSSKVIALGYSNGANIASSLLLLYPELLHAAALLRPMLVLEPSQLPDLSNRLSDKAVFLANGSRDPVIPMANAKQLATMLRDAGAQVSHELNPGSHGLIKYDIIALERWFKRLLAA